MLNICGNSLPNCVYCLPFYHNGIEDGSIIANPKNLLNLKEKKQKFCGTFWTLKWAFGEECYSSRLTYSKQFVSIQTVKYELILSRLASYEIQLYRATVH